MVDIQQEGRIYNWDVMEIGHDAPPIFEVITKEYIAEFCESVQETDPIYLDEAAAKAAGFPTVVAPPSMVYAYAPMRRWDIFNIRGYLGPEQATSPRSTPFAGSEVFLTGVPVMAGDIITSIVRIDNRWISQRGNKFVTFKIIAHNQRGEKIVEYNYNILWEYYRGQKGRNS